MIFFLFCGLLYLSIYFERCTFLTKRVLNAFSHVFSLDSLRSIPHWESLEIIKEIEYLSSIEPNFLILNEKSCQQRDEWIENEILTRVQ